MQHEFSISPASKADEGDIRHAQVAARDSHQLTAQLQGQLQRLRRAESSMAVADRMIVATSAAPAVAS